MLGTNELLRLRSWLQALFGFVESITDLSQTRFPIELLPCLTPE